MLLKDIFVIHAIYYLLIFIFITNYTYTYIFSTTSGILISQSHLIVSFVGILVDFNTISTHTWR